MVKAEMSPDNASILVCGGGGIALDVTRKLKDMGAWVWMLQRSDSRRCVHAPTYVHPSALFLFTFGSQGMSYSGDGGCMHCSCIACLHILIAL